LAVTAGLVLLPIFLERERLTQVAVAALHFLAPLHHWGESEVVVAEDILLLTVLLEPQIQAAVVVGAVMLESLEQAALVLSSSLIQTFTLHQQLRQDRQQ
jgi:hypothetical protein